MQYKLYGGSLGRIQQPISLALHLRLHIPAHQVFEIEFFTETDDWPYEEQVL